MVEVLAAVNGLQYLHDVDNGSWPASQNRAKARLHFDTSSALDNTGRIAFSTFALSTITDPQAAQQWHLTYLGDIEKIWEDYTGNGVSVGVYDSGVQYAHYDLAENYDPSKHVVVDGYTYDGDYRPASGPHGTSVAGIIAAARNDVGTVGVAYGASLTGVNIFDPYSEDDYLPGIFVNAPDSRKFIAAMYEAVNFDVVNHSWGGANPVSGIASRAEPGTFNHAITRAVEFAAEFGRGGLGTISVGAAGNSAMDGQDDAWKTDRHTIAVAAYREVDGSASLYSNSGAHLLVSAPSSDFTEVGGTGLVTTDLLGRDGYNLSSRPGGAFDYTDQFGGTSGAAPVVTGVVSLMLDANENLGWRDVKNILAVSAKLAVPFETGRTYATSINNGQVYSLNEQKMAMNGSAADWNGGRMHYSNDYGYGAVDAYNAVRMAEVWSLFGTAKTSANETVFSTGKVDVNLTHVGTLSPVQTSDTILANFAGTPTTFTFNIAKDLDVDHIDFTIDFSRIITGFDFSLNGSKFKVTAPDGTEGFVDLAYQGAFAVGLFFPDAPYTFTFGLSGFRGVQTEGEWKFQFEQLNYVGDGATDNLTINSINLDLYGSVPDSNDVYTYTDEFFTMAAIEGEGGRQLLTDSNGGSDWINAAAVSADVHLSLAGGQVTTFDGENAFTIGRSTLIEHAVTGDGNDRLIGNALDNRLYGMRGDDWLNGGAGNDTLFGGQGRDVFAFDTAGVSGNDVVLDWSAGDRIATSKMLRGADQNGLLTVGSNALLLLDGIARGDTAELSGQGGAVLQVLGRSEGYWWYGYVSDGDADFVDGRVIELALGQTGRPANDAGAAATALPAEAAAAFAMQDAAFYLYDTMGDAMASGVQTWA